MAAAGDDGPGATLGALLSPHLAELALREPEPTPELEPDPPQRLDEAQLMALIFTSLTDENLRVCEGIDFDRLVILAEPEPDDPEPDDPEPDDPEPEIDEIDEPEPGSPTPTIAASEWVGRTWADGIATVPAELLDRPAPQPAWLELRARAESRPLDTLNLRRLDRATALRHLELFVHACRAKRRRLCRVITGKGVESRAEPVLKRAAIEWCLRADAVLDCAPWLDRHGEWGALILELRAAPGPDRNGG